MFPFQMSVCTAFAKLLFSNDLIHTIYQVVIYQGMTIVNSKMAQVSVKDINVNGLEGEDARFAATFCITGVASRVYRSLSLEA